MHCTVTDLVSWTANSRLAIFHFHFNIAVNSLFQFTFWSFYRNHIISTNCNCYTCWEY